MRPAATGVDYGEIAEFEIPVPFRVEGDRDAGREVRLAGDELAAPGDLDDEAVLGQA